MPRSPQLSFSDRMRWLGGALFAVLSGILDPLIGIASTFVGLGDIRRWDTPRRRRRGLIIVLGGIEGPSRLARAMGFGILRSRWRGAVVVYRWNAGPLFWRAVINLMSPRHHRRMADGLVELIREHRRAFGANRIALIGQSGGCWIIVQALELLRPDEAVDRAALLAPAISPGYDPSRAAAACRGGMMSIGGRGDLFYLALCTSIFGTSDRSFGPAAGCVGWRHAPNGFYDVRWRPEWIRLGYLGNHVTACSPRFIAEVIAPWLACDDVKTP